MNIIFQENKISKYPFFFLTYNNYQILVYSQNYRVKLRNSSIVNPNAITIISGFIKL